MGIVKQNRDNMDNNIYISLVLSSLSTLLLSLPQNSETSCSSQTCKVCLDSRDSCSQCSLCAFCLGSTKGICEKCSYCKDEQKAARKLVRKERKQTSVKNVKPIVLDCIFRK